MPPRKTYRRAQETPPAESAPESIVKSRTNDDPNASLHLVQLPIQLFDATINSYATVPVSYYYDTQERTPPLKYYERNDVLTALSQTCTALREIALPRLWERLDMCRVPERAQSTWYKYVMLALERKSNGMAGSPVYLRQHVRTLTLMLSKSNTAAPLAALWALLPKLPALRTIHIISCKTPGFAKSMPAELVLPTVTTLLIPEQASALQRICPDARHIRCVGGHGDALLSGLTDKTEVFDGMVDWSPKLVDLLSGLGIESQNKAPAIWVQAIPHLAPLIPHRLATLILTFPAAADGPDDAAIVNAASALFQNVINVKPTNKTKDDSNRDSQSDSERRLVIRRVVAPHYESPGQEEDVVHSLTTEVFECSQTEIVRRL